MIALKSYTNVKNLFATQNEDIVRNIGNFVYLAFKLRNEYILSLS